MKPTKHARSNYQMISPFLEAVNASPNKHRRFTAPGFMPLSLESLGYSDHRNFPVYAMAHYGTQNGDLMADPDMTFSVDFSTGEIHPMSYQNDYLGMYQQVYKTSDTGKLMYSPSLRTDLDRFLWQWLKNISLQGFSPEIFDR